MFEPDESSEGGVSQLEQIYRRGPVGALTVAGIAMALVFKHAGEQTPTVIAIHWCHSQCFRRIAKIRG
jgi:hypothetical protein